MKILKKPSKPWHWCTLFLITATATGMLFYPEEVIKVEYVHPAVTDLKQDAAEKADSLSLLSDKYMDRLKLFHKKSVELCNKMSSNIIFGHNIKINNETLTEHVFHECNGKTWLNADIIERSDDHVLCHEEYAKQYQERAQPKKVVLRAINTEKWVTEKLTSSSAQQACIWAHAIDILNRDW